MVVAPCGRARCSEPEREPLPRVVTYYRQRVGAGLIVSEATHVSLSTVSRPGGPGIHDASQVVAWRKVTDAVHTDGGRIFQQLFHLGRKALPARLAGGRVPLAPSAIAAQATIPTPAGPRPFPVPKAATLGEVATLIDEFAIAIANSRRAGFDGVEIHGAHGYLIDQFLRDSTNRRDDLYGGSIANRARFLLEVVDRAIATFGAGRVGVRVSPHFLLDGISDSDPAALYGHVAAELGRRGIAYLHLVEPANIPVDQRLAVHLRTAFGGPLILCGELTRELAETALEEGRADLVSFGRLFIANPDLPERFRRGAGLNDLDPSTLYNGDDRGYIDYPIFQAATTR